MVFSQRKRKKAMMYNWGNSVLSGVLLFLFLIVSDTFWSND